MAEKILPPAPNARDWMEPIKHAFRPTDDLLEAIAHLSKHHIAAAPVVGEGERFLGMLTEKDCLRLLSVTTFHHPRSGLVGDFMSEVPNPLPPDIDVFDVVEEFLAGNFPALPVIDSGRVVGVISRQRMLKGVLELLAQVKDRLQPDPDIAKAVTNRPHSIEGMQRLYAAFSPEQIARVVGRKR